MNEVLISVIIATYNAQKHLEECLQSIFSQEFKSIEVIVVDGKSKDNTVSILKKFEGNNFHFISEKDKGIYDALNKGTKLAKGRWLHFLGSDDRLLKGFSEMALKLNNERTVYYGNSEEYFTEENKPPYILLNGKFSKYRLAKYCINHQAILYPKKVFEKYQYSLRYKVFGDYDLNLKVWGDKDFRQKYFPIYISRYNMNGMSSLNKDILFKQDKPKLIRKSMGIFIYLRYLYKRQKTRMLGEKGFE